MLKVDEDSAGGFGVLIVCGTGMWMVMFERGGMMGNGLVGMLGSTEIGEIGVKDG